jgi:hypothetical protein
MVFRKQHLKNIFMKIIFFLLALLFPGHSAVTTRQSPDPGQEAQETAQPPVYFAGRNAPAASGLFIAE